MNHLDLVGWINTARYKWAEMIGREIKFRPATFYLGIVDMLAGEVEGLPKEPQAEVDRTDDDKLMENVKGDERVNVTKDGRAAQDEETLSSTPNSR